MVLLLRKLWLFIWVAFMTSHAWGQGNENPVHIFQKATGDGGFEYFAQNKDFSPYQIQIDFTELLNLQPTETIPYYRVIYPGEPQKLFRLKPKGGSATSFKSQYQMAMGDPEAKVNLEFIYWLPFEHNKAYIMIQGANGDYTHQGKNAFDFVMEEGTKVCASRDGKVVAVKEDSRIGGPDISFMRHGNRITVLHEDGSFADYVHLKYQGSLVAPGEMVKAGQVIGYSGNTGWSTKPHLHFQVYKAVKFGIQTLPAKFLTANKRVSYLKEMETYKGYHPR